MSSEKRAMSRWLTLFDLAKSGSDWTDNELRAYNIRIVEESPEVFFGRDLPNDLNVDADLFMDIDNDVDIGHVGNLRRDKAKTYGTFYPEAQLMAEAIAAVQFNNKSRVQLKRLLAKDMVMPVITMVGMRPAFYKIPVSTDLAVAVAAGVYPEQETVVKKCLLDMPGTMKNPAYRRFAIQHCLLFRDVVTEFVENVLR
ncbi:hypothetical protein C0995_005824 [Termitomyces sp. Mi166|nr:hypothetical protein C0995_005824 [Termitomyces sp. Mi166\